ncbi:MAG: endonuclease domain-containing protein [Bdellovibrionales bacterium]
MGHGPFFFERYEFDGGTLRLHYRFESGPFFEEQITFPPAERSLSPNDRAALDAAFRLVFLLAGVSYYKAYVAEDIKCPAFALDEDTAAFIKKVYRKGLAEFAYSNALDLSERIKMASQSAPPRHASPLNLPRRSLVPVGGGKDSIVTLECLKEAGEPLALFVLSAPGDMPAPIAATVKVSGLPVLHVSRQLSPELAAANKAGAYNGHIPITAILSSIAIAAAILHGFDTVVLSNEHSASAPNLRLNEQEINHQYSKSYDFETDLARYAADHIAPDIRYFSLLRPLSEAEIARRFARHTPYHPVFLSCNKAFRQNTAARGKSWCCACPKCRFVFLALAPFLNKDRLVDIFGKNLLDDEAQTHGFAELCGLTAHKPFECVGETGESSLLLGRLYRSDAWKDDKVVKTLGPQIHIASGEFDRLYGSLFAIHTGHSVPDHYMRMLDANH